MVPTLLSASTRFLRAHERNEFCTFRYCAFPWEVRRAPLPPRLTPSVEPEPEAGAPPAAAGAAAAGVGAGADGVAGAGVTTTGVGGVTAGVGASPAPEPPRGDMAAAAEPRPEGEGGGAPAVLADCTNTPSGDGSGGRVLACRRVWYAALSFAKRMPVPGVSARQ